MYTVQFYMLPIPFQSSLAIILNDVKRFASSHSICILCTERTKLKTVPRKERIKAFKTAKLYIPVGAKVCESHLHINSWSDVLTMQKFVNSTHAKSMICSIWHYTKTRPMMDLPVKISTPSLAYLINSLPTYFYVFRHCWTIRRMKAKPGTHYWCYWWDLEKETHLNLLDTVSVLIVIKFQVTLKKRETRWPVILCRIIWDSGIWVVNFSSVLSVSVRGPRPSKSA